MIGFFPVFRIFVATLRKVVANPESRGLLVLVVMLVGVGSVFYRVIEDLAWVDSVYLAVIALTTVGFGDITPATDAGKIFTIVYVLIGVGVLVAFVTDLASQMVEARAELRAGRARR